jgi:murein DD-endopeptidase MepM/ murein hydrolase activator NlpD
MMTTFVSAANSGLTTSFTSGKFNAGLAQKFRNIFKPRDIFLHDGKSLRRFTIGAKVQIAAAAALAFLLAWSAVATVTAFQAMDSDVARMEAQVDRMQAEVAAIRVAVNERAAELERRQGFLNTMLSGHASAADLSRQLPRQLATPTNAAALAMTRNFDRVEAMQVALVERAQAATRQRYSRTAGALRAMGFEPARLHVSAAFGMGGPFEPVDGAADNADPRFRRLFASWRALDQLEQSAASIPSARPIAAANFTSGYGVRSDPFRGRAAMHAGIDLAGPIGTPIYATADGIVGRSEYNAGGYGNLVEINHGPGIQTRYGHLSQRIALPGQRVRRGQLIGLMGSTGRSTGSHLHYEVRIDGRAVNPIPFMQPSNSLAALERPVAIGGPAGGQR